MAIVINSRQQLGYPAGTPSSSYTRLIAPNDQQFLLLRAISVQCLLAAAPAEIHVLKSLKHRNIMSFFDWWYDGSSQTINFITEYFTSGNLRQ